MGRHTPLVEPEKDPLGFDPLDGETDDLGQSSVGIGIAEQHNSGYDREGGGQCRDLLARRKLLGGDAFG